MDDFIGGNLGKQNPDEPVHLGEGLDEPIRLEDIETGPTGGGVSHAPLDLGGGPAQKPTVQHSQPVVRKAAQKVVSGDRITGVRTFFTKLHPGSLPFLDEQICSWLKENPGIQIKHTNITTGEVQAKKTEPNIIVTVWY